MPTKEKIIDELKGLGVTADPNATYVELNKLLKETKAKAEPRLSLDGEVSEPVHEPEARIQPSAKEDAKPEIVDYLRKYQYRKQTKPGSVQSNPAPGTKAAIMKDLLLKQPRVRIFIPLQMGESRKVPLTVTLNGYRLDFPKQQYLELPNQIADVIMESQKQTDAAILRGQITGDEKKEEALL